MKPVCTIYLAENGFVIDITPPDPNAPPTGGNKPRTYINADSAWIADTANTAMIQHYGSANAPQQVTGPGEVAGDAEPAES